MPTVYCPTKDAGSEATIAAAYALNDPILVYSGSPSAVSQPQLRTTVYRSLLAVDQPNMVIETVKVAEDGRDLIVRFYECQRRRGPVTLRTGFELAAAWRTNLLEEKETALPFTKQSVTLQVHPYEIGGSRCKSNRQGIERAD